MTTITKMRLKGFKSFAKAIDLEFGDRFNCILGPNGSGKSNVMDALCFVLGKMGAKSMRAEKTANLIFNGGKDGSPAKEAEVAIYFANQDNEFPVDQKEVKISRILRSTGQSIYKINDETRTRQQVLELLSAAKVDPDGHNIILQGDIVRFMEMRTEHRREMIEEIAGISLYEDKKAKALNELGKVDTRLNEATIIMTERETYLKELKKERDQAMKYKDLEKNIKSNKATYLHVQITEKEKKKEDIEGRIQKHEDNIAKINDKIKDTRKHIDEKKKELDTISQTIEEKGEKESIELQKNLETIKTDMVKNRERLNTCNNEINKVHERKQQLQTTLKDIETTIKDLENSKKDLDAQIQTLQIKENKTVGDIKAFKVKHGVADGGNQLEEVEQEIDAVTKDIQEQEQQRQALLQKKFQLDARLQQLEEKITNLQSLGKGVSITKLQQQFDKASKELSKALNEDSFLATQLGDVKEDIRKREEQLYVLQAQDAGRKTSAMDNTAVKKILALKKAGIYGTVAQLGKVDKQYAVALEVAAGGRMNNIVVQDEKVAADCIKLLKRDKLGTATFLPVNKIKARVTPSVKGSGIIGNALDLIKYDNQFKNVFSFILGNAVVVNNLDTARRIGIGKARMVTLDGDLCEVSGAMIGGFRHKTRKISFQDATATGDLTKTQQELDKFYKIKTTLEKRRSENEESIDDLRQEKHACEGELIKAEKTIGSVDIPAIKKERDQLKKDTIYEDLQAKENNIARCAKELAQLRKERDNIRASRKDLNHPEIAQQLEKLEQKRQATRDQLVQLNTETKNIETQITNIYLPEQEKTQHIMKQHDKETSIFKKEAQELQELLKLQTKELKDKESAAQKFHKDYKDLFTKRNKTTEDVQKRESSIQVEDMKIKEITQRMNDISINRAKIVGELEGLQKEYDEYKGVELRKHISEEKLKDEIRKFEQHMQQMGNVNLRALEVYEDIRKEYDELLTKMDKLKGEKDDVLDMIHEIETKKKDMFMKTFNFISKNFTRIFSSLSSKGSEAQLYLENKEEPLTAGVDIKVKIVGNRYLDVKSMSGGEKTMAALAFIFAIQEHQPGSFYILDEVDAALDKKNSELLSKLVAKYADNAQYIMISHNDAVISEAEQIYGVSMHPSGVSKITSLKV